MSKRSAHTVFNVPPPSPWRHSEYVAIAQRIRALPGGHPDVYRLMSELTPDDRLHVACELVRDNAPPPADVPIVTPAAPTLQSSWVYFAWLLLTAVALYYAKLPILIVATIVGVVILWVKFAMRFPLVAIFIMGFLSGLMRGGRR